MIALGIFIGILWVFFVAISLIISFDDESGFGEGFICGAFIILLTIAEILIIHEVSNDTKPHSIDVYRKKTELEIHSINGVPQDTVVVWKGGEK
jgi:hypothetical protein